MYQSLISTHLIKCINPYFEELIYEKDFELRKDDREYKKNDRLIIMEWEDGQYTNREIRTNIKYILRNCPQYGLQEGYCILGLSDKVLVFKKVEEDV